jgi:protein gp37
VAEKSGIEWTDATWNPVTGCTKVSPGCKHCYAERLTERFGRQKFEDVILHPDRLDAPLHWRKPRRVFVNSMSDLFHEDVPFEYIDRVFAVMACAPSHTFQILTKRADRMQEYATALVNGKRMLGSASHENGGGLMDRLLIMSACGVKRGDSGKPPYRPFPNVWLGVSVENQEQADKRIPLLLQTPAAVRFLSVEPLLERISLAQWLPIWFDGCESQWRRATKDNPGSGVEHRKGIGWVIVGGESGPGARPCNVEWIRSIVRQCREAGVSCFVKQDSGPRPGMQGRIPDDLWIKEFPDAPRP